MTLITEDLKTTRQDWSQVDKEQLISTILAYQDFEFIVAKEIEERTEEQSLRLQPISLAFITLQLKMLQLEGIDIKEEMGGSSE